MKLILENFRCHNEATFNFQKGMTLISGNSGCGKSTICEALKFVLYGIGTKVVTSGKKSCSVTFEMNNMKIVRSKSPNRLIVNDKYEDKVAQDMINEVFGNSNFETISYLTQNALNSFIMMSPINKLDFIETFAFKDVNLKLMKSKLKEDTLLYNKKLTECTSKLEVVEKVLQDISKPNDVEYPFEKKYSKKNELIIYKNNIVRQSKNEKETLKLLKMIKGLTKQINNTRIYETNKSNLIAKTEKCENELYELNNKIESIKVNDDNYLTTLENKLQVIRDCKEYIKCIEILNSKKKTLSKMEENEKKNIEEEIQQIVVNILSEEEINELKEQIDMMECIIKVKKRLSELNNKVYDVEENTIIELENTIKTNSIKLEEVYETIEKLKLQKNMLVCPKCDTKLKLIDQDLVEFKIENEVNSLYEISELNTKYENLKNVVENDKYELNKLNDKISMNLNIKKEIDKQLSVLHDFETEDFELNELEQQKEEYIESIKESSNFSQKLAKLKYNLANNIYSMSYMSFKGDIELLEKKMKSLKCDIKCDDVDEEKIRTLINNEKNKRNELSIYNSQKVKIQNDIYNYKIELNQLTTDFISKYKKVIPSSRLENVLKEKNDELILLKNKTKMYITTLEKIGKYNEYMDKLEKYNEWKSKYDDLIKEEEQLQNLYSACLLLKTKILEAESIVMVGIIESINKHAQVYLDLFFPENPININVTTYKKIKKISKPQIDIEIFYKGMECNLSMLSGGELSRVVLAFTLALGEIFNIPLLLLDECTANLDESLTADVFEAIKNNFNAQYILVIAHQIVNGQFDNIVNL